MTQERVESVRACACAGAPAAAFCGSPWVTPAAAEPGCSEPSPDTSRHQAQKQTSDGRLLSICQYLSARHQCHQSIWRLPETSHQLYQSLLFLLFSLSLGEENGDTGDGDDSLLDIA